MSRLNKTYLCFTFLFMAIGWGICLLCSFNGISLNDSKWLYAPFLLGGWSPTIASYLSLRGDSQVAGMKEWLKNIFDLKHNVLSYLMVAVMAIIFILPQCLISGYESGAPVFAIIVMIPMMLVGGGLEEAGWRYILQPELEKKYPFTVSTILVLHTGNGPVWAELFRIRNKRLGIKLCSGKHQKEYGQRVAMCIISLHRKLFLGDLYHP